MLLQGKIDRAMNWLKEKNNLEKSNNKEHINEFPEGNSEDIYSFDPKAEWKAQEEEIKLEKGDIPALIISALLVFGPIFLALIAILIFVFPKLSEL